MHKARMLSAMIAAAPVTVAYAETAPAPAALKTQSESMPPGFSDHFYNVPLATRVVADGELLGEAMVVMDRNGYLQLLHFNETEPTERATELRARIDDTLRQGLTLGPCAARGCSGVLRTTSFDISTSTLSLVTFDDKRASNRPTPVLVPTSANGMIVRQRLNVATNDGSSRSLRYWVDTLGSVHGRTTTATAQYEQTTSRPSTSDIRLQNLHAQRELKKHFIRVGFFMPDALGLYRQPRTVGARGTGMLGAMFGSSDSLRVPTGASSVYPIYVSASRAAIVEIRRDGALIHSQPVASGLQPIDTTSLPTGIYYVDVRVVEDGVVRSTEQQLIYKPAGWADPNRRWRYNAFAGRRLSLDGNSQDRGNEPDRVLGVSVNALVHPRAVLGVSVTRDGASDVAAASIDIDGGSWATLYANVHHASDLGKGADIQWIARLPRGSVSLGYGDTWITQRRSDSRYTLRQRAWTASGNMRFGDGSQLVARVSRATGQRAHTYDLGFDRNLQLYGSNVFVHAGAFDRPILMGRERRRDRGVELRATFALSSPRDTWSATAGQRAGVRGGRDTHADLYYMRQREGTLSQLSGTLSGDRYGVGGTGTAVLNLPHGQIDTYAQRSSLGDIAAGMNLENTFAYGEGHVTSTGMGDARFADALMAIDLVTDVPEVPVHARNSQGDSIVLKPGRNVLPLPAYLPGRVNIDTGGHPGTAASVDKRTIAYQVNRGSVAYSQLEITRMRTILGRLVNPSHQPIASAMVTQGQMRTMTDDTGVFVLDVAAKVMTVAVSRDGATLCELVLPNTAATEQDGVATLGDLTCAAAP